MFFNLDQRRKQVGLIFFLFDRFDSNAEMKTFIRMHKQQVEKGKGKGKEALGWFETQKEFIGIGHNLEVYDVGGMERAKPEKQCKDIGPLKLNVGDCVEIAENPKDEDYRQCLIKNITYDNGFIIEVEFLDIDEVTEVELNEVAVRRCLAEETEVGNSNDNTTQMKNIPKHNVQQQQQVARTNVNSSKKDRNVNTDVNDAYSREMNLKSATNTRNMNNKSTNYSTQNNYNQRNVHQRTHMDSGKNHICIATNTTIVEHKSNPQRSSFQHGNNRGGTNYRVPPIDVEDDWDDIDWDDKSQNRGQGNNSQQQHGKQDSTCEMNAFKRMMGKNENEQPMQQIQHKQRVQMEQEKQVQQAKKTTEMRGTDHEPVENHENSEFVCRFCHKPISWNDLIAQGHCELSKGNYYAHAKCQERHKRADDNYDHYNPNRNSRKEKTTHWREQYVGNTNQSKQQSTGSCTVCFLSYLL